MSLQRIILTVPFMRHYAGSVFDLYENDTPDGWDPDERFREKISFLDKRTFLLPDGGKGAPCNLPKSDTIPCPGSIFEEVNLKTGPCRITSVQVLKEEQAKWNEADAALFDKGGHTGQGILIQMGKYTKAPFQIELTDVRENKVLPTLTNQEETLDLDFSDLSPGFYQLTISNQDRFGIHLRFIKCFPLVILFKEGTRQIMDSMKTVY